MPAELSRCRSCGAPIRWVTLNGKPHPVDAVPVRGGRLRLEKLRDGRVAAVYVRDQHPLTVGWTSHFASCPQAASWRRRR